MTPVVMLVMAGGWALQLDMPSLDHCQREAAAIRSSSVPPDLVVADTKGGAEMRAAIARVMDALSARELAVLSGIVVRCVSR